MAEGHHAGLADVFHNARYEVELNQVVHTIEIGRAPPPAIADWLAAAAYRTAWIITAHNPDADCLPTAQNSARQLLLQRIAGRPGVHVLRGRNIDPAGRWRQEPTLWLAGYEEGLIRSLAARFGQAAVVAVRPDQATLVWTAEPS